MRTIVTDGRRALLSKGFLFAALGMFLVLMIGAANDLLPFLKGEAKPLYQNRYWLYVLEEAMHSDAVYFLTPILASLPFTASFVDDLKSGFLKQFLPRTTRRKYAMGRTVVTFLTGGLALLAGIALMLLLCAVLFKPREFQPETFSDMMLQMNAAANYRLLMRVISFFVIGGFWSLVGGLMASVSMNKYMAYATPFIFYYLLIILVERYFRHAFFLYPKEWIYPTHMWPMDKWGVPVLLLGASLLLGGAYMWNIVRRARNE